MKHIIFIMFNWKLNVFLRTVYILPYTNFNNHVSKLHKFPFN